MHRPQAQAPAHRQPSFYLAKTMLVESIGLKRLMLCASYLVAVKAVACLVAAEAVACLVAVEAVACLVAVEAVACLVAVEAVAHLLTLCRCLANTCTLY